MLRSTLAATIVFGLFSAPTHPAALAVRVVTLGTGGGPVVRLKRAEEANALVVGDRVYLVDCGDRCLVQLAAAHIPLARVQAIFITHYHQDHVGGLMPLLGIRWMTNLFSPLKLLGPPGLEQIVKGYRQAMQPSVDAGFGATPDPLTQIEVREVGVGEIFQDADIKVTAVENAHYTSPVANPASKPKSYSYRIETPAGSIVFTGDTAPSPAVTSLAKGADLLISEVIDLPATISLVEQETKGRLPPQVPANNVLRHLADDHMTPEQVGQLAKDAGVKRVVLSHLSPGTDSDANPDAMYAAGVRSVYKGPVTVAADLDTFDLNAR
jgi:ribonuclease BN (tRNA processing enzyme)